MPPDFVVENPLIITYNSIICLYLQMSIRIFVYKKGAVIWNLK